MEGTEAVVGESQAADAPVGIAPAIPRSSWAAIIEVAPDPVLLVDRNGRIVCSNAAAQGLFGYEAEALLDQPVEILIPPSLRGAHRHVRFKFQQEPRPYLMGQGRELCGVHANGQEIPLEIRLSPLPPQYGPVISVWVRDLRAQQQERLALRAAETYSRQLLEASADAVFVIDVLGVIVDVNARACDLSGYPRQRLIGMPTTTFFPDTDQLNQGISRILAEGFVEERMCATGPDGQLLQLAITAAALRAESGRMDAIVVHVRNITTQQRIEDERRELQARLGAVRESCNQLLLVVDQSLRIVDANAEARMLLGGGPDALLGSPLDTYLTPPAQVAELVRHALHNGTVRQRAVAARTQTGHAVSCIVSGAAYRQRDGNPRVLLLAQKLGEAPLSTSHAAFENAPDAQHSRTAAAAAVSQAGSGRAAEWLQLSTDGLVHVDWSGRIVDANRVFAAMLGKSPDQLLHLDFESLCDNPDDGRAALQLLRARECIANYPLQLRGERVVPVLVNAAVAPGDRQGVLLALRDLSLQRHIERELREQQLYTRALLESSADAWVITDLLGVITDVNERMCELTGLDRAELLRTPLKFHFAEVGHIDGAMRQVLSGAPVRDLHLILRGKQGRQTPVSYHATTVAQGDGKLRAVASSMRDLSSERALEEELHRRHAELSESLNFLNSVLHSATEYAIIAQDMSGLVLSWNDGASHTYGYSAKEMVGFGSTWWLHTAADIESGRVQRLFDEALHHGKAKGIFERRHKSGGRLTAALSVSLRRDSLGTPLGYLLISKDVTEQQRLEEALSRKNEELADQYRQAQEANRLKTEFLASMSHELRTPLNAIIGFSELMYDGKVGSLQPDHQEFMGDILNSARHLLRLINDVLDLSKVEAGRMELITESVELDQLIGELRTGLSALMAQRRIQLAVETDPALGSITVDVGKLKQVLYNYLSNAFKFSAEGSVVTVRARAEGPKHYRLEVQDQGIGIREEDQARLFQEFQQLEAGIHSKYRGTGLGLALTKRLVEAQGGTVGVRSVYGQGSCFFAILPMQVDAAEPFALLPSRSEAVQTSSRVLVVEGEADRRTALIRTLSDAGYEVDSAVTAAGALALSRKRRYDAVSFNIRLPDRSGWAFLHALQSAPCAQRMVAIALSASEAHKTTLAVRVDAHLLLPLDQEAVASALDRANTKPASPQTLVLVEPSAMRRAELEQHLLGMGYACAAYAELTAAMTAAHEGAQALLMPESSITGLDPNLALGIQDRFSNVVLYTESLADVAQFSAPAGSDVVTALQPALLLHTLKAALLRSRKEAALS